MIVMPGPPGGREMRLLVVARTECIPAGRLAAVLARFAYFLAASSAPVLAVLARTPRVAERVLTTAGTLDEAPAARHLEEEEGVVATARRRVVVGVVEPHPVGLATELVWATPADRRARQPLAPVVASLRPTGRRSYPATRNPSGAGAPAIRKEGLPITITTRKAVLTTTPAIRKRVVGMPRRSSMSASDRKDPLRVRRDQSTDAVAVSDRTAAKTATPLCHHPVRCDRSHGEIRLARGTRSRALACGCPERGSFTPSVRGSDMGSVLPPLLGGPPLGSRPRT